MRKKKIIITIVLICVFTLSLFFASSINKAIANLLSGQFNVSSHQDNILVHFISVGQGDATAINLPDGKIMLVDTGPTKSASEYINYMTDNVINSKFGKTVDYLVMTHADDDHTGGVLKVLQTCDVKQVYLPVVNPNNNRYNQILQAIQDEGSQTEYVSDSIKITNGYTIDFFGPMNFNVTNKACPIIKISYCNTSFLITGDIDDEIEKLYVNKYGAQLSSTVLKVAHHGSKYSSCVEFLNVVKPNYAVISVGKNSYGHPTSETLDRLTNIGAKIYRTDNDGTILFEVGNEGTKIFVGDDVMVASYQFDYVYFVLIVDMALLIHLVLTIINKKDKKKH